MAAHILVAGGGIGGLSSALALARHGHRVEVLEQAPRFGDIGAGVQLGPNTTRRLDALGLSRELLQIAARPDMLVVRSADRGAELARLPLGAAMQARYGAAYYCVHRADLHGLLLAAVREVGSHQASLNSAARVIEVVANDDLVCASSADVRAWEGDALIGADGLWSRVRRAVLPQDVLPRNTGHTAWRALVPQADLPAALRNTRRVDVWLGSQLHAVAYPVRGGEALNLVVVAEARPAGALRDWDQASSLAALQQAIGPTGRQLQALLEAMPAWHAWTLCDRAPLAGPGQMVNGRIALIGDAAHPMLPYLAQGAGMAIEDAVALADAIGVCGPEALPDALLRYANARWQRNAQVQARAARNGEIFHATGAVRFGRDMAMRVLGARLLDQPWLYGV